MRQPVQNSCRQNLVGEDVAPVAVGLVRGQGDRTTAAAAADELKRELGCPGREYTSVRDFFQDRLGFEHGCSWPMDGCARSLSACPRLKATRSGRSSHGFATLCLCGEERLVWPESGRMRMLGQDNRDPADIRPNCSLAGILICGTMASTIQALGVVGVCATSINCANVPGVAPRCRLSSGSALGVVRSGGGRGGFVAGSAGRSTVET